MRAARRRAFASSRSVHGNLCFTKSQKAQLMLRMVRLKKKMKRVMKTNRLLEPADLMPGLIDDVVSQQILPRLPWYQRPVMKAVSKSWCTMLESPKEYVTRSKELLHQEGLILLYNSGDNIFQHKIFEYFDSASGTWHELPPVPGCSFGDDGVEECFCLDGCVYSICKGNIYKLDVAAGLWQWERLRTQTRINNAITVAFFEDGRLYMSGKFHSVFVMERHDLVQGSSKSICVQLDRFSGIAAQKDELIALFDDSVDRLTGSLFLIFQIKPLNIKDSCTPPTFISRTEFYVATRSQYLQYHDMRKIPYSHPVSEINLPRKLGMYSPHKILALAHKDNCIYAILEAEGAHYNTFSLWKGVCRKGSPASNLNEIDWQQMNCPLKYGETANNNTFVLPCISLQIFS